ncbi:hypothetical protein CkaCkLH20_07796 [Colletotrichum karsti]|uniref:Short chain dehydrogenase citE n=1 Tax=Colletotrichum karsti TaxID=1095194 RepID=A0A9P6I263_9PEZI|nr:uncharacterized protein CkaCkLH20_07796 [Colletotrichum karsti]KAF9874659.1 hypothetical protein CkaCkLH20_07796 [Colletotrichum karsti]
MSLPSLTQYHKKPYPAISPSRPELNQSGKTVLITGGSSGIGFAIARNFVAADAERVIILGRREETVKTVVTNLSTEATQSKKSTKIDGRVGDAFDVLYIEKLWKDLQSNSIFVDVLVLNAAGFGAKETILQGGISKVWADFEANVRSPLAMTDYFYKQSIQGAVRQKFLVNISTVAAYMWTTMGPDRPTYGLTKNSGTLLLQQIAKDTKPTDMQIVSIHPGGVLTDSARSAGFNEDMGIKFDDENLPSQFSLWAASPEARFLHGRFVWANWDVEELMAGLVRKQIEDDEHFLKVGIEGLSEKTGGMIL